jgi:hypothetical protein
MQISEVYIPNLNKGCIKFRRYMEYSIYFIMEIRSYYGSVCLRIRTSQLLSWKSLESNSSNICEKSS